MELKDALDPVEAATAYYEGGADEIAFLDITATVEKRRTVFDIVEEVARSIEVPLVVGGGIKGCADVEEAVKRGASKVSISSAAYRDPEAVGEVVREFGSQRIIVAIDADLNEELPSKREVYIDGGRTPTGTDAVSFAKKIRMAMEKPMCGELHSSARMPGMMAGCSRTMPTIWIRLCVNSKRLMLSWKPLPF